MNKHCMPDDHMVKLKELTLAPYLQLSVRLIDVPRKHLSNAFRHQMATLAILIDYGYTDPVLLKASVIHDIIEDCEHFNQHQISRLEDGEEVLKLVLEVSKKHNETKKEFLSRILVEGSERAKILKSADRISNLIDMGFATDEKFIERYLKETTDLVIPMTKEVSSFMVKELEDLIISRGKILEVIKNLKGFK